MILFKNDNLGLFNNFSKYIESTSSAYLRVPRVVASSLELLREELEVEVERDELLEEVVEVFVPPEVADWAGEADTFRLVEADVEVFVVAAPVERFTRLVVVVVEGLAVVAEVEEAGVRLLVLEDVEEAGVRLLERVDVEEVAAGVRLLVLEEVEDAAEEAGVRLLVLEEVEDAAEEAGVRLLVLVEVADAGLRLLELEEVEDAAEEAGVRLLVLEEVEDAAEEAGVRLLELVDVEEVEEEAGVRLLVLVEVAEAGLRLLEAG